MKAAMPAKTVVKAAAAGASMATPACVPAQTINVATDPDAVVMVPFG